MRKAVAVMAAKLAEAAAKTVGRHGSSLPGVVALKICPDILRRFAEEIGEIVVVLGTNGKTTTNNMTADIFEGLGRSAVCNRIGSNLLGGVAAAFIDAASPVGTIKKDVACLEIDEAYAHIVLSYLHPSGIAVTNVFRDQMDRYGEIDTTIEQLRIALEKAPDAKLILNADDPLTASLGVGRKNTVYYGISEDLGAQPGETRDGRYCRLCGTELTYAYRQYGQLGDYRCEGCGFSRPTPQVEGVRVSLGDRASFDVNGTHVDLPCRGIYNVYNALAAFALAESCGVPREAIAAGLGRFRGQVGRMEEFTIGGKTVVFNLAKNPAGMDRSIGNVLADTRTKDVVIGINDNDADGNDVSWLWDAEFEKLNDPTVCGYCVTGIRAKDMAVRLKYCDLAPERIAVFDSVRDAVLKAVRGQGERVYVIVNYTMLLSTEKILRALEEESK